MPEPARRGGELLAEEGEGVPEAGGEGERGLGAERPHSRLHRRREQEWEREREEPYRQRRTSACLNPTVHLCHRCLRMDEKGQEDLFRGVVLGCVLVSRMTGRPI